MDAVIFPGQGSQKPGMGAVWAETASWAVVDRISAVLGRNVGELLLEADAPTLQATRNAQVASFALGLVIHDAVQKAGMTFGLAAGHSLGEYTALVAAGVLDVEAAAALVGERAEAMQTAADGSPGTMTAILGLDADAVAAACARAGAGAWIANDNAPGQIVIAGTPEGVAAASEAAKEARGKVRPLVVGGAFHTPLMASAQARLDQALTAAPFRDGDMPVVANVDAAAHRNGADWRSLLSRQLCNPVRWRESVAGFESLGVSRVVELGPDGILGGMVKRIAPELERVGVAAPGDIEAARSA
jgi:[acyl-carrier-protein] S-malonyltransferase